MMNEPQELTLPEELPLIPLKNLVLFPFSIHPLNIGRPRSVQGVDEALNKDRLILFCAQKDPTVEEPLEKDIYPIGTIGLILRMMKSTDGMIRLLVQGVARAKIKHFIHQDPFFKVKIHLLKDQPYDKKAMLVQALMRTVHQNVEKLHELGKTLNPELLAILEHQEDPGRLADLATQLITLKVEEAQKLLETLDPVERLQRLNTFLEKEVELLSLQREISNQARSEIDKVQREFFLRQQLKAIQKELGERGDLSEEIETYRKKCEEKKIPKEVREEVERQFRRLERTTPESPESQVIRTYLDWITGLPWGIRSRDNLDISRARVILDEDHYDLEKVKERILEFLAVRKLKGPPMKGPILCFVGPPGVGKTSLGKSIARALGRKFVRISLGGIRDEAEIRGHRRTYIGALPGRILRGIFQAGTSNPVFMLDEIDKIGADFRGDPSSALLEVLDPEQNHAFSDHYLEIPYDLSQVMFIATANYLDPIHPAVRDRMEVIHLPGYTDNEKLEIAKTHLIPKQKKENGLASYPVTFTKDAIMTLITRYTREAGLRNLERQIASIFRKIASQIAEGKLKGKKRITPAMVRKLLGPPPFQKEGRLKKDQVGIATGLAWTPFGGDILFVEALVFDGKGDLILTGHLGEVMKESAMAALSYARSVAKKYHIPLELFEKRNIHIHVPAGAIPKDGPSAGITMAVALISALTARPIKHTVAMTGEITLRGEVLPVGGIKEKVLAAHQAKIQEIILPKANRNDLEDIPKDIRESITFHFVSKVDKAIDYALQKRR